MHCNHLAGHINEEMIMNSAPTAHTLALKPSSKVLMVQVLGKSDPNPPNVKFRCILAKLYKAKKHLDQGEFFWEREIEKKRDYPIVTSSSDQT